MQIVHSSPTLIRLAIPQDRNKIIKLEKLAIEKLCQNNYNSQEIDDLTRNIDRLSFNDEITFVAERDGEIVGFASLLSYRKTIRTLYVKANLERKEIENQLLNAIESEAIDRKIKTLNVTSSLLEKTFYNSQGYRDIAECNLGKMDILVPCIAMQKRLIKFSLRDFCLQVGSQILLATVPNLFLLLLAN